MTLIKTEFEVEPNPTVVPVEFIKEKIRVNIIPKHVDVPLYEEIPQPVTVPNYKDKLVTRTVEVPEIEYNDTIVEVRVPVPNNITVYKKVKKVIIKKEIRLITKIQYNDIYVDKTVFVPTINPIDKPITVYVDKPVNTTERIEVKLKFDVPELEPNFVPVKVNLWEENVTAKINDVTIKKPYYVEELNVTDSEKSMRANFQESSPYRTISLIRTNHYRYSCDSLFNQDH